MGMAATAEGRGNGSHIRAVFSRAHAVIAAPVAIVPHDAERMFCGQAFTDLTGQDGALDRRHDGSVKVDQHRLRRELAHEFVFITEDGATLLFQLLLLEVAPEVIVEWVGGKSRTDFPAGGERPGPEVFVLNILEEPGHRLIVRPFPCQDRTGSFHVEVCIGQTDKGLFCGGVVIQYEEGLRVLGDSFQRFTGIAKIHDDDSLALEPWRRRIAVFDGNEPGRGESFPNRPGGAEAIGTFGVIEHDRRGLIERVLYAGCDHRGEHTMRLCRD